MLPIFEPSLLTGPAQRILTGPAKMQEMAARGVAIGVAPADLVLLLVGLLQSPEPGVGELANHTLSNLPQQVLQGALTADLHPLAVHHLAVRLHDRLDVLARLLGMPRAHVETVTDVARVCSEEGSELIATNEERLLANPALIEALYLNKRTRMSTADRIIELAVRNNVEVALPAWKEVAAAIQNELIPEPTGEPTFDDQLFAQSMSIASTVRQEGESIEDALRELEDPNAEVTEEKVKEKYVPLYRQLGMMTNTQKIRFASVGTPEAIMILINDASPLVSVAAAKSTNVNEAVAEQVCKRRNISPDVLLAFGNRPELFRRMSTKRDLMKNPKTPPSMAMKFINHFQAHELERMVNDRNISGAIRAIIKQHLERKTKKG